MIYIDGLEYASNEKNDAGLFVYVVAVEGQDKIKPFAEDLTKVYYSGLVSSFVRQSKGN